MRCITDVLHTNLFHVVLRLVVPSPRLIQSLCLVQLLHHILPVLSQCLNSLTVVLYLALQGVYLGFSPVDLPQNNTMHMTAFYMSPTLHELSLSASSLIICKSPSRGNGYCHALQTSTSDSSFLLLSFATGSPMLSSAGISMIPGRFCLCVTSAVCTVAIGNSPMN